MKTVAVLLVGVLAVFLIGAYWLNAQGPKVALKQPVSSQKLETKGNLQMKEGQIILDFALTNHSDQTSKLQFNSGQQFEVVITDENNKEVYRFSEGKFFTQAMVDKDLKPGESISWQDVWDMTDKEGTKLNSGKYTAEITILAKSRDDYKTIDNSQLTAKIDFNLSQDINNDVNIKYDEKGFLKPEFAKQTIKDTADKVIYALSIKDAEALSAYVHPLKGLRFTPYTYVSPEKDVVFTAAQVKELFKSPDTYQWGYYDGSGEEILLTPSEYYDQFVYSQDFLNAEKIGYNEVLSFGNALENQFEVYPNTIIVEYYFSGFNPDYAGMDWRSLRLVFEEYEGSWKLVGLINNQWTI